MKAIGYFNSLPIADPRSLQDLELPAPVAEGRDLLVRVHAISVNPVDTKMRTRVKSEDGVTPRILGWDVVGTVEAAGPDASLFKQGDRVFYAGSIARSGANSELHLVDERIVGHAPKNLGNAEAAAMPLTSITAWELLFDRLQVPGHGVKNPGALLVVGGAGGVGSILIQLARKLTGLKVIATASRPETADWCMQLGAHAVIDHSKPIAAQLKDLGVPEVRYIVSLTRTERHFADLAEAVSPQGRFALIDDPAEPLDVMKLKRKSVSLHWESMFTRSLFGTPDMIEQHHLLNRIAALLDDGMIRSTMKRHMGAINAANVRSAHELIEGGSAIGKVVLEGFA